MTTTSDALFEPFCSATAKEAAVAALVASGIVKRADATTITINPANPKSLYSDAATEIMDYAAKRHPQMFDTRIPAPNMPVQVPIPIGAYRLDQLVDRFHDGKPDFWVACPGLTPPKQFEFAGRFGYLKVWRFSQQMLNARVGQFIAEWFWINSTEAQLSAIELGILCVHPNMRLHHIFDNQIDAQSYFIS